MGLLALLPILKDVIGTVIPDPNKRMELELQLAQLEQQESQRESNEAIAQIQVNQTQAANASIFVSGPRPALMWTGVVALAWEAGLAPLLGSAGVHVVHVPSEYFGDILWFTAGLCGLRGFEKFHGVARNCLSEASTQEVAQSGQAQPLPRKQKKGPLGIPWPF